MSSNHFTCKLPVLGSNLLCFLDSYWTDTNVKLILIHDNQAWTGMFQIKDNEDVTELIDQLSLTEEKYMEETRNALTTHNGAEKFAYAIENDVFTWKKFIRTNMAIKFGYVMLSKIQILEAFETMIDISLQSNVKITERLSSSVKEMDILEKENHSLKEKLQELIVKKSEMETKLYSQFLELLNTKKMKIQELEMKLGTPNLNESESDSFHQNNDPFNSEIELNSENEEEHHSPKKVKIVESRKSFGKEKKNTVPNKSRKFNNKPNVPSTCRKNIKAGDAKRGGRKLSRESCVLGMTTNVKDLYQSEDEAFMFAKCSKRSSEQTKLVKPSISNITDDSDETYLENTVKPEPLDSDNTPSDLDIAEQHTLVAIETEFENIDERINAKDSIIDHCKEVGNNNSVEQNITAIKTEKFDEIAMKIDDNDHNIVISKKMDTQKNNQNKHSQKSSHSNTNTKGLSTSTLNILNQLI